MGVNNNIYLGTPPNILHTLTGGIMKMIFLWIVVLTFEFQNNLPALQSNDNTLDIRLRYMADNCNYGGMSKTYWATFRNGITYIAEDMRKNERQNTTGAFGGFISSSFISLLFQIHFAIGWGGDIFPNSKVLKLSTGIKLGNIQSIIQKTIIAWLSVYYEVVREQQTKKSIFSLGRHIKSLKVHIL